MVIILINNKNITITPSPREDKLNYTNISLIFNFFGLNKVPLNVLDNFVKEWQYTCSHLNQSEINNMFYFLQRLKPSVTSARNVTSILKDINLHYIDNININDIRFSLIEYTPVGYKYSKEIRKRNKIFDLVKLALEQYEAILYVQSMWTSTWTEQPVGHNRNCTILNLTKFIKEDCDMNLMLKSINLLRRSCYTDHTRVPFTTDKYINYITIDLISNIWKLIKLNYEITMLLLVDSNITNYINAEPDLLLNCLDTLAVWNHTATVKLTKAGIMITGHDVDIYPTDKLSKFKCSIYSFDNNFAECSGPLDPNDPVVAIIPVYELNVYCYTIIYQAFLRTFNKTYSYKSLQDSFVKVMLELRKHKLIKLGKNHLIDAK